MLEWQTAVCVAGQFMTTLESYDSLHERIRDVEMRQGEEGIRWLPPIEITIKSNSGRPVRCMVAAQAVAAVIELAPEDREPVETVS